MLSNLTGQDKNAYYHELFIRSKSFLSHRIQRTKIKGQGTRKPSSPDTEPNFYNAPYLPPTIAHGKNPWTPPVCNSLLPSEPNIDPGTGCSVSLQQLLACSANDASFQNQQTQVAPLPLLSSSMANLVGLEAYQLQAHLKQIRIRQEMQMLPGSFLEQLAGRQDNLTVEMALALFRAGQEDVVASSYRW